MNTKSKIFSILIQKEDRENNEIISHKDIEEYLKKSDFIDYCAYILHNKDTDENGVRKTHHFHIVIRCFNAYAKETILNDVCKHLVKNRNIVSVRALNDLTQSVCYLVHRDNKEKHKYDYQELFSNNVSLTEEMLNAPCSVNEPTIQDIIMLCAKSHTIKEVYISLGLKNAKLYRNVIKDLFEESRKY